MGKKSVYLAVDIGASSGRLVAGSLSQGRLELSEVSRFENPNREAGGLLRWDLEFLVDAIRQGIRSIDKNEQLVSLGIDTWAVDFVLVGENGEPVEPARAYRNVHTREFVQPVHETAGENFLYAVTGIQTQHFNTIYQLAAWKAQSPESWNKARTFAMVPDWLAHRLGAPLRTELSNASTTQLINARTRDWDRDLLDLLGLPRRWFSKPLAPGSLLAPRVNLEGFTLALVAPATHDTGSAVASIPLEDERSAYIATGTWCLIGVELCEPETRDVARKANFTNEAGVDGTSRFLKNCMGLWLLQGLKNSWGTEPDFGEMVAEAARAPAFEALVDVDDGSFFQPVSVESLHSWWQRHGVAAPRRELGRYARACLEGLVLAFRGVLKQIEAIRNTQLREIHLVGGGAQNALLCQWTADATGLPVMAGPVEASALGNVMTQARVMGEVADTRRAREVIAHSFPPRIYRPTGTEAWEHAARRLEELKANSSSQGVR